MESSIADVKAVSLSTRFFVDRFEIYVVVSDVVVVNTLVNFDKNDEGQKNWVGRKYVKHQVWL